MKKILLACTMLATLPAWGQFDGKVFTVQTGQTYTNLTTPTIVSAPGWDDFDAAIPLGFNMSLFGKTNDSMFIDGSNYGLGADMLLHEFTGTKTAGILFATDFFDRLNYGLTPSTVGYKTDVVSTKKITKMEWNNAGFYGATDTTDFVNFQVWLYENNNDVEVRFGNSQLNSPYSALFDMNNPILMFIKNFDTSYNFDMVYFVKSKAPAVVDSADAAAVNNGADITYTGWPTNGTVFRFAKPTTGINGTMLNKYTEVYPTVFNESFTVAISDNKFKGSIALIDMNGKLVLRQSIRNGRNVIPTSGLASGQYTIHINNGTESVFYKLTKQ